MNRQQLTAAAEQLGDSLVELAQQLRARRCAKAFNAEMRETVERLMALTEEFYRRAECDEGDRG